MISRNLIVATLAGLLVDCSAPGGAPGSAVEDGSGSAGRERAQIRVLSDAEVIRGSGGDRQRLIADLLYEGLQALDADRLLTPIDDNAHARFKRVLAYDPGNELALEGLENIVLRYVDLAEEAAYQGLFEEAETFLDRARFVDDTHPAIARVQAALEAERNSGDLFFELEASAVRDRSSAVQERLAEIASQAREHEAFFLITAPSDAQARWMYSVMREAVSGYRLRGNIELASRFSVRLRMPDAGNGGC